MEVEQADKKMQPATPMAQSTSVATEQAVEPAMSAPQEKIEPIIPAEQKDKYDKQMQTSISTMNPKVGYDKIDETIKASNSSAEHKKREEIEEKRRKRAGIFNAISDGIAALANVYFTSKGAPAVVYDENNSLSARARARWDKMDAERKTEEAKQYLRDKERREEENRLALEKYNKERQAILDEERREDRRWQKEYQQQTLENQKEIAELNAAVRREGYIAANERDAARQKAITYRSLVKGKKDASQKSVTPLYLGEGEVVEVSTNALRENKNISAIYNALPETIKQEAFKRFNLGKYDNLKQLTPAQMEQIIGEYIEDDGAEEARKIIRSLANTGSVSAQNGKASGRFGKSTTNTSNMKPLTGVE